MVLNQTSATNKKHTAILLVVLAAVIIAAAVLYFIFYGRPSTQNRPAPQGLGGQIYERVSNPLKNKLPDINPAQNANPIQGLNTNPF